MLPSPLLALTMPQAIRSHHNRCMNTEPWLRARFTTPLESTMNMCGMTTFDHDDPFYAMFQCDPSLKCDSHVESDYSFQEFHQSGWFCVVIALYMLDSHVELHTHLKAPEGLNSIVPPICKACLDNGCHIIVRHAR